MVPQKKAVLIIIAAAHCPNINQGIKNLSSKNVYKNMLVILSIQDNLRTQTQKTYKENILTIVV
ncbi:hypothetical protein B6D52_02655 [Candidatus Parcubacteria bacterium 4484_255]|nr:MAG: hypothetical protein B6D52_02655 [Candidatus Parcubacteria bacterium 4484_255]